MAAMSVSKIAIFSKGRKTVIRLFFWSVVKIKNFVPPLGGLCKSQAPICFYLSKVKLIPTPNPHFHRRPIRRRPKLAGVEVVIEALAGQQRFVGAVLDDLAVVNDQNLVGVADGAQAVGDDETGPAGHQAQHGLLDLFLGAGIDAAGRFVQD